MKISEPGPFSYSCGGTPTRGFRPTIPPYARYRWTTYRANALGQFSPLLSPHPVYLALGAADYTRRVAYRSLFRPPLDPETISDLRLALIP